MLITFLRAVILYIVVLIIMRLMGKREIGQLQPFELAISIMIADLAAVPMSELGIPLTNGIIPILALLVMYMFISALNMKSINFRKVISGQPSLLIYRGKIDEKVLRRERITINELQERLRGENVFNLSDVEYAILETNGEVTVIQKPERRNLMPQDLNIIPEYEGISYDLVVDGKVMEENLRAIGRDRIWLDKQLKKFDTIAKDTLIATIDGKGAIFCQKKENSK